MSKPDSNRTGNRPSPPPEWSSHPGTDPDSKVIPNILRVVVIALTIIGILFALRTIYIKVTEKSETSRETSDASSVDKVSQEKEDKNGSQDNGAANDDYEAGGRDRKSDSATISETSGSQGEEDKGTGSKSTGYGKTKTSGSGDHEARSKPAGSDNIEFRVGKLDRKLTNIERNRKSIPEISGIGIYKIIAENLRQSVRVQLAILENAVGPDELAVKRQEIQIRLERVHKIDNVPYYHYAISEYSIMLAETSVSVLTLLTHASNKNMQTQIASIRNSWVEATCDSAFVTARAFLAFGKLSDNTMRWDYIESKLKAAQDSEQPILRKTVSAHYLLGNILMQCIQARDRKMVYADTLAKIKKNHEKQITTTTNAFFKIAIYTESELSLMILLARIISQ